MLFFINRIQIFHKYYKLQEYLVLRENGRMDVVNQCFFRSKCSLVGETGEWGAFLRSRCFLQFATLSLERWITKNLRSFWISLLRKVLKQCGSLRPWETPIDVFEILSNCYPISEVKLEPPWGCKHGQMHGYQCVGRAAHSPTTRRRHLR